MGAHSEHTERLPIAKAYRTRESTGPGEALTTDIITKLTCCQKCLLNIPVSLYRLVLILALENFLFTVPNS